MRVSVIMHLKVISNRPNKYKYVEVKTGVLTISIKSGTCRGHWKWVFLLLLSLLWKSHTTTMYKNNSYKRVIIFSVASQLEPTNFKLAKLGTNTTSKMPNTISCKISKTFYAIIRNKYKPLIHLLINFQKWYSQCHTLVRMFGDRAQVPTSPQDDIMLACVGNNSCASTEWWPSHATAKLLK